MFFFSLLLFSMTIYVFNLIWLVIIFYRSISTYVNQFSNEEFINIMTYEHLTFNFEWSSGIKFCLTLLKCIKDIGYILLIYTLITYSL